jgi:ABC-2 type transport system permease protein
MSSADLLAPTREAVPVEARYHGVLLRQIGNELRLVFRRRRNLAMLIVLGAVPALIGTAVKLSAPRPGQGPPFISQITGNGLFLAFASLTVCLPVFLPLAVAVVAGDSIAGEANTGTLRYLLTVPVSRTRLLAIKSIGTLTYIGAAIGLVALVGIVIGVSLFGTHGGVTLLSGDTVSLADGLLRTVGVAVYVFVDLLGLAAIAMFLSTLTEVPVGAMAGTVAIVIIFAVLDSVPQLGGIRGLLLTHHWLDFGDLLRRDIVTGSLLHGLLLPLGYTAIFGSAAWARLSTSDITS